MTINTSLTYPQIAARVFDTPLLIQQRKANAILRVLSGRLGFQAMEDDGDDAVPAPLPPALHAAGMAGMRAERMREGHYVVNDIAVVPVVGTLVQRGGYIGYSGMTSYDAVERMFAAAMNDAAVESIVLEIDSPGGEVGGVFDLADRIYRSRGTKPSTAVASDFAASAAYLLGSAAGELVLPPSGMVGSIGVVTAHVDYSKALDDKGIAVTFIHAGEKKVDGNPYQPLSERAQADLQADIDRLYGMFVQAVSTYRGVDAKRVRATEAGMYMGQLAIAEGLATRIGSFSGEFERLLGTSSKRQGGRLSRLSTPSPEINMGDTTTDAVALTAEKHEAAKVEAHNKGKLEGAKAERERIKAIVLHEDAAGRSSLANHLAFDTDMSAEAATALMGKTPKLAAPAGSSLAAEMAKAGTPGISADLPGGGDPQAAVINATAIYSKRSGAAKH